MSDKKFDKTVTVSEMPEMEITREQQIEHDIKSLDHALEDCTATKKAAQQKLLELQGAKHKVKQKIVAVDTQARILNTAKDNLLAELSELEDS